MEIKQNGVVGLLRRFSCRDEFGETVNLNNDIDKTDVFLQTCDFAKIDSI